MYHTSPHLITEGSINKDGVAGDCLFFSHNEYHMASASIYTYEADFECIEACRLDDEEIIAQIAEYFNLDEDTAYDLLTADINEWRLEGFDTDAEDSWWLQGKRGECAVKMGYDGCEDIDEQGTVYIVPMFGREKELKLVTEQ